MLQFVENSPGCDDSCAGGEQGAAGMALVLEERGAAGHQGVMIHAEKMAEHGMIDPMQQRIELSRIDRILVGVQQVRLALFAPRKKVRVSSAILQDACDQQPIIGVDEIIACSLRETIEESGQCPEGAAFAGLVGAVDNMQP